MTSRGRMPNENQEIAHAVKEAVLRIDPRAQVVLYGSRARGDAQPDSDWDFLILLSIPADFQTQRRIRRNLCDVECLTGEVITTVIHSVEDWRQPRLKVTPFYENVSREGIPI
ncbi:MAG: nucleotidyltransferase domain-containing protein [Candidatus Hydrogenedentes bacterium]|nr:nucleotidyltransferase domain-containing protein [Candidatus Hydrogenedentota bacterium]